MRADLRARLRRLQTEWEARAHGPARLPEGVFEKCIWGNEPWPPDLSPAQQELARTLTAMRNTLTTGAVVQ